MTKHDDTPALARAVFDRSGHRRTDEPWLAGAWARSRVLLVSPKSATPIKYEAGTPRVQYRAPHALPPDSPRRFLGLANGVPYFTVTVEPSPEQTWQTLREVGPHADDLAAGLLVSAIALEQWHQRHTHCPRCGARTVETQAGWTRTCTEDGSEHFPRTDPAVIMLIHDSADRVLLGRGHQWGKGRFSTLAGFVEPGESLESAVTREVFEEVGIGVSDVRYVASQPWPFPASLMLGFVARLDGDASITLDPVEMAEAGWFNRAEVRAAAESTDDDTAPDPDRRLRAISPRFSISRFLIDRWLDGDA